MNYQGTRIEINLNNLKNNLNYLRNHLKPETSILCVVKAFGYGSNPIQIGKFLEKNNVSYLAVAYTNEGINLRKSGIKLPILILHPQLNDFDDIIHYKLEPNIYSFRILDSFLQKNTNHPFHIKFNTGLNRLGFGINDIDKLYELLPNDSNIKFIFSHLGASEDLTEKSFTVNQINLFCDISKKMQLKFGRTFKKHLLNTSGILNYSKYQFDMVRSGIGIYGYGNCKKFKNNFKPVISLKSVVSQIHEIKKGESVGYNRGFIAKRHTKVAIIPIGHADGIHRSMGNGKIGLLINNKIAKTIGNICMDMMMIDVTNINCNEGDSVTIIDDKNQTAEDIGDAINTISYEVLTSLSNRINRVIIS